MYFFVHIRIPCPLAVQSSENLIISPDEFDEWELLNDSLYNYDESCSVEFTGHFSVKCTVLAQDAVNQWRSIDMK